MHLTAREIFDNTNLTDVISSNVIGVNVLFWKHFVLSVK